MEILRAKTIDLRQTGPLTPEREENSRLNEREALEGAEQLLSCPRRLVLELTSACNLRCVMCGRNAASFRPTVFDTEWLKVMEPMVSRIEEVTLMGWGEPTIHPRFPYFLQWAHHLGLRKYFCTNGMRLKELEDDIFAFQADIIAVSLDGANRRTNEEIRRGADFTRIIGGLEKISNRRAREGRPYPYLNFVFTAMNRNIRELPEVVKLAAELGLDEVKAVYFTAFDAAMDKETLYGHRELVSEIFGLSAELAASMGVSLKLPHLQGDDPAGEACHKTCYTAWRDLFLGSDGAFRPCMSTARKFFQVDDYKTFEEIWNSPEIRAHRCTVNTDQMNDCCRNCYQSSYANWNRPESFNQSGLEFAPEWDS
ncbi:radical SAM protein [Deltaproteobacteria bacterium Smac51]|nr:radical SAM protein [Deltaproteobacteria bacterium Smac51]